VSELRSATTRASPDLKDEIKEIKQLKVK